MLRDEEMYPDPDSFKPERFFNDDGTLNGDTVPYAFGFGRRYVPKRKALVMHFFIYDRVCPGRHMAETGVRHLIAPKYPA